MKPDSTWQNNINDWYVTDHFTLKEFECPCCRRVMIHRNLIAVLESIRHEYSRAILVTSGYRCRLHNLRVGGSVKSKHLYGEAEDIVPKKTTDFDKLTKICLKYSYTIRVILYTKEKHIHIELRE